MKLEWVLGLIWYGNNLEKRSFNLEVTSCDMASRKTPAKHNGSCCEGTTITSTLLPKKILKGPSELNAENLGARHMK